MTLYKSNRHCSQLFLCVSPFRIIFFKRLLNVDVPRIVQGTGETEPTMMLNSWVFRARRERTSKPDIIGVRWMLQALRREKPPAGGQGGRTGQQRGRRLQAPCVSLLVQRSKGSGPHEQGQDLGAGLHLLESAEPLSSEERAQGNPNLPKSSFRRRSI